LAGIFVVMQLIVLGIEKMDSGTDIMEPENLLLKRNELIPFLGITGNRNASNRKLKAPLGFDGGSNNGIVAEDLFDLVGIGRLMPNSNACRSIMGKLWATKAKSIGSFAYQG
jgi:hypothetical protein